jgi:uncharacterized membrane protein (Fun14 family)
MGYCSAMAMKKIGKAAAFVVGVGFFGVQVAAHLKYIDVDWNKVKDDALKPFDTVSGRKRWFLLLLLENQQFHHSYFFPHTILAPNLIL